jgi:uncharacterized protein (DUF2062 family)
MKRLKKQSAPYWYHKILRERGTPDFIARGWAAGLFVNFFIPCFFQIVTAIPLAFLFKGSRIAAVMATFISNNFTIPLIYPVQCYIGGYLICKPLRYEQIKTALSGIITNPSYESIYQLGMHLVLSFFAGGTLLGVITAISGYFIAHHLTAEYQQKRHERRMLKRQILCNSNKDGTTDLFI